PAARRRPCPPRRHSAPSGASGPLELGVHVVDGVADRPQLLQVLVVDPKADRALAELLLQALDQLDQGQGVGIQVLGERGRLADGGRFDLQDVGQELTDELQYLLTVHGTLLHMGFSGHGVSCFGVGTMAGTRPWAAGMIPEPGVHGVEPLQQCVRPTDGGHSLTWMHPWTPSRRRPGPGPARVPGRPTTPPPSSTSWWRPTAPLGPRPRPSGPTSPSSEPTRWPNASWPPTARSGRSASPSPSTTRGSASTGRGRSTSSRGSSPATSGRSSRRDWSN